MEIITNKAFMKKFLLKYLDGYFTFIIPLIRTLLLLFLSTKAQYAMDELDLPVNSYIEKNSYNFVDSEKKKEPLFRTQYHEEFQGFDLEFQFSECDQQSLGFNQKSQFSGFDQFQRLDQELQGFAQQPQSLIFNKRNTVNNNDEDGEEINQRKEPFPIQKQIKKTYHKKLDKALESAKLYFPEFVNLPKPETPRKLKATLQPHQIEGFEWMTFLKESNSSGILADDMGLGKTVQTIAYIIEQKNREYKRKKPFFIITPKTLTNDCCRRTLIKRPIALKTLKNNCCREALYSTNNWCKEIPKKKPFLIVAPKTLMSNWSNEIVRFAPHLQFIILHGKDYHEKFSFIEQYDVVLTTYTLVTMHLKEFKKYDFYTIILDEAQKIKNADSKTARAVCQLNAQNRFCLTGTPIENSLDDLYSLFQFLGKDIRTLSQNALYQEISPFILRRTKEEMLLGLPPKTEHVVTCVMNKGQRNFYDTYYNGLNEETLEQIEKMDFKTDLKQSACALEAILRLRQICCDPRLFETQKVRFLEINQPQLIRLVKRDRKQQIQESAKLQTLMGMMVEMIKEGRRILLFSNFSSMLALIENECRDENIPYVILTGKTKDREAPIDSFQNRKVPLFLISLKAGGAGLNLTQADTVIHYDPWWNPAVEAQATDRAYRIGQNKPVAVYKMIVENTIEEKIIELQQKKGAVAKAILDGGASGPMFNDLDIKSLFEN
jgi:SNF2 family DNA or RNA helicase